MTNQLLQPKEKQFRWPHGSPILEKVDVAGHNGRNGRHDKSMYQGLPLLSNQTIPKNKNLALLCTNQ